MRFALVLIAVAAFSSAALAQKVYKHTDPGGNVTYSDDPNPGKGSVTEVETPVRPDGQPAPDPGKADRQAMKRAQARSAALDRAAADIVAAVNALRVAEANREPGIEPLEGERSGRRLRPEYWARQQALKSAVDEAQARLDEAIARRNALR